MSRTRMRWVVNRFREPGILPRTRPDNVAVFHRSLAGYRPTPLHQLPHLARELGLGAIYVKDESQRFGLNAFKVLGASWAIHRLLAEGMHLSTVATATAGNHGRAVAWAARRHGLRAVIFIPSTAAPAKVEAIRGEGAEVVLVSGTYEDAVRCCAARSADAGWQVVADVGYGDYLEIPRLIAEGYGTLLEEVDEELTRSQLRPPDFVLVQAGVGGLAAAVTSHYRARDPAPFLVVVEPAEADCLLESATTPDGVPAPSRGSLQTAMSGLNCAEVSRAAWPVVRRGADLFLSIDERYAADAVRRLAEPIADDPRIVAGPSGAAGLAGLLAWLRDPAFAGHRPEIAHHPGAAVLLINTEGQ